MAWVLAGFLVAPDKPENTLLITKTRRLTTTKPPTTGTINLKGELLMGGAAIGSGAWYAGGTAGFSSGGGMAVESGYTA